MRKKGYHIVSVKIGDLDDSLHKIKNGQLLSTWDDLWKYELNDDRYYWATSIVVKYTINKDKTKTKYEKEIIIPDVVNE